MVPRDKNKLLFIVPESWSNGSDVSVQAAFRSSNTQRQRSLQDGSENLHLVSTAVLGNLEPLHQKLEGKQEELKQLSSPALMEIYQKDQSFSTGK